MTLEEKTILVRAAEAGIFDELVEIPKHNGRYVDTRHPGRCRRAAEIATALLGKPVAAADFADNAVRDASGRSVWTIFGERVGHGS